jgi:hypothetical protein
MVGIINRKYILEVIAEKSHNATAYAPNEFKTAE